MEPARQRRRLVLACLAVACLGCGGAVPPTNYYVLDLPARFRRRLDWNTLPY